MNKITINTNEGRFYFDSDSGQRLEDHIARRLASKQGKTCWYRVKDDGRCDTSRYFSVAIGTLEKGGLSNTTTLYFSIPFTEYAKIGQSIHRYINEHKPNRKDIRREERGRLLGRLADDSFYDQFNQGER